MTLLKYSWFGSLEHTVADRLNPIVLRELRQMTRNNFVVGLVICLLIAFFLISSIFLTTQLSGGSYSVASWKDQGMGAELLGTLFLVLAAGCITLVPVYVAFRFWWERCKYNFDLMYISTLPPSSIVWGKLLAALHLSSLVVAVCLPFMALTYFLRGVDILEVIVAVTLMQMFVLTWTMMLMFLVALRRHMVVRVLLIVIAGPILFFSSIGFVVGTASSFGTTFSVSGVLAFVVPFSMVFWGPCMLTAYGITVLLVSPKRVDRYSRELGVRHYEVYALETADEEDEKEKLAEEDHRYG